MAKLVNKGASVDLYFPAGHPDSLHVEADQVVDLGDVRVEDGGDCWLTGEGDNLRAWSKDQWDQHGTDKTEPEPEPEPETEPETDPTD